MMKNYVIGILVVALIAMGGLYYTHYESGDTVQSQDLGAKALVSGSTGPWSVGSTVAVHGGTVTITGQGYSCGSGNDLVCFPVSGGGVIEFSFHEFLASKS